MKTGSSITRRNFLRGAATTGAGFVATSVFPKGARADDADDPKAEKADDIPTPSKLVEAHVYVNQFGYAPGDAKRAVIPASNPLYNNAFAIVDDDSTPEVHFHGVLEEYTRSEEWKSSRYKHRFLANFDLFDRPGRYRVRLSNGALSAPFTIGTNLYPRLAPLMLRYFEVQRCGDTLPLNHDPCHKDDGIISGGPRAGQKMDASGGWHDAGDYLKFVMTTSYVTAVMLTAYDRFPRAFTHRAPHSRLPLLLHHAKVGLDWLLKMHPAPDEFYYQVGDENDHNVWRLPEADDQKKNPNWKSRTILYGIGANLAGRVAASFAMASLLYGRYDKAFAERCLVAAQSVYALGLKNRRIVTTEPFDFYPEKTWEDDMEWGAAALYRATGQSDYQRQALEFARTAGAAGSVVSVYDTHALAHAALYPLVTSDEQKRLKNYLYTDAEHLRGLSDNLYGLATSYSWGTAETAAGAALTCLLYANLPDTDEAAPYLRVAQNQRDFILGCNPFNLSMLIGAGARYPQFPHHQVANLKNVELTGALIGGPANLQSFRREKFSLEDLETSVHASPADIAGLSDDVGVYRDVAQDYVTNEPANDYTATLLLLTAFYHETYHNKPKEKKSDVTA